MYIQNLTQSNLTVKIKGSTLTLKAGEIALIPDGLITIKELQAIYGPYSIIEVAGGATESLLDNQQKVEVGKLYVTEVIGPARLFVGVDGSVDVYGSDSASIPSAFTDMSCPEVNEAVTGTNAFETIPRYIAFKTNEGTPEIIVTNCKCYEVSSIA